MNTSPSDIPFEAPPEGEGLDSAIDQGFARLAELEAQLEEA
jgi:hypothetical protein